MDCFCEMVSSGLKKLAMSHPCDTREERDSYLGEVKRLCGQYGISYYPEDQAFITDLFLQRRIRINLTTSFTVRRMCWNNTWV